MPKTWEFVPLKSNSKERIILTVDEYESIRLIDKCGLSQEECAQYMDIARTTAQQIYNSARKKIADAIVLGIGIKIEGGEFRLCDGDGEKFGCVECKRLIDECIKKYKERKEKVMKIIIPVDDEKNVCVSFARAPQFAIKDSESGVTTYIDNPASEAQGGAGLKAAQVILDNDATVLLTVRLGEKAAEILQSAEIEIYKTDGNNVEDNFEKYLSGKLEKLTKFHAGYQGIQ